MAFARLGAMFLLVAATGVTTAASEAGPPSIAAVQGTSLGRDRAAALIDEARQAALGDVIDALLWLGS